MTLQVTWGTTAMPMVMDLGFMEVEHAGGFVGVQTTQDKGHNLPSFAPRRKYPRCCLPALIDED
jgi:hypothetical protein